MPAFGPNIKTTSLPAPSGGLNARDAIASMPETDAVTMENWFPTPTSVDLRNGSLNHATGLPGWVETLAYYSGNITKKLLAISSGNLYDVTASGAVGAAKVTGLSNSRFQFTNIGNTGGRYIVFVNGADKLIGFDGAAYWRDGDGTHDITGVNSATLIHCNLFKNRLWFVQNQTMSAWYLGLNAIAGAAVQFDLSSVFKLGGYLMAMTNWTIDNVSGIDDYAVFITSEGEFAIYKGTDPSSASTFALVGVFRIGKPVGRRCFVKVASDAIIICADGAYPLSQALQTDRAQNKAISEKITNLINSDVATYGSNFGWQLMLYPLGNKFIVNVPQIENSTQYQYVMNTINDSWCKFTGWNAACWEFFNDGIYFGGNGVVTQADTGTDDNGSLITANVRQAFSYFKTHLQKRFSAIRAIFSCPGTLKAAIAVNIDFSNKPPTSTSSFTANTGSPWNTSPWNTSPWQQGSSIIKQWQSVSGIGFAAAVNMSVSVKNLPISWMATDFVYEPGGIY